MARSILQFAEGVNVKYYGAVGNGVTDDTAAIALAISAIPSTGGVLIFPPGTYVTSGGFTLAYPTAVIGYGKAGFDGATGAVSRVLCNSATATLFTVTAYHSRFENIALSNTAATAPTDGSAVVVAGDTLVQRVDFDSVSVNGFYINIDVQVGCSWSMENCWLYSPVLYGLKIRNTENGDAGDWAISNTNFFAAVYDSDAAIRMESSGGGKIINCKFNMAIDTKKFLHGIDVNIPAGGQTSILLISNSSFENVRGNGINASVISTGRFGYIFVTGSQFALYENTTGHAISITADTLGNSNGVIIANNIFLGGASVSAIDLTKINQVSITDNINYSFGSLLTQSGCTNVVGDGLT